MNFKKWWNGLKSWQKGGLIGAIVFTSILFIFYLLAQISPTNSSLVFTFFILRVVLFFLLIFSFFGICVKILSSLIKSNFIFEILVISLSLGVLISYFTPNFLFNIEFLQKFLFLPIFYLNTLVTGCNHDCMHMFFISPLSFALLSFFILSIIEFFIIKLKKS